MEQADEAPLEQAGTIPYRVRDRQIEFCLITSARGGRWGFPKGLVDPGDTPIETALKESYEEAGLSGEIIGEPLGRYQYFKWGKTLEVTVYVMHVTEVEDDWQEAAYRERTWCIADEARRLIDHSQRRQLLETAIARLKKSVRTH